MSGKHGFEQVVYIFYAHLFGGVYENIPPALRIGIRGIYIYIYICLHVVCTRLCTSYASACKLPITLDGCPLEHWLLFGAPLWGVALLLGMSQGASSAEDSPNNNSDLSHLRTATGHRQRSSSHTVTQREEYLAAERLWHIPFFLISSYYACSGRNNVRSSVNFRSFFLNWPHIPCDQYGWPITFAWLHNSSVHEGALDERLGLSSSVPCCWVQLFYTFLVLRGSFTDC